MNNARVRKDNLLCDLDENLDEMKWELTIPQTSVTFQNIENGINYYIKALDVLLDDLQVPNDKLLHSCFLHMLIAFTDFAKRRFDCDFSKTELFKIIMTNYSDVKLSRDNKYYVAATKLFANFE